MAHEDRLVERLDVLLSSLETHVPLGARRRGDGSVEVLGLGVPASGTDSRCLELIEAIVLVEPMLDPDDLYDRVCEVVLESFEE